jgi:hypothetical protein
MLYVGNDFSCVLCHIHCSVYTSQKKTNHLMYSCSSLHTVLRLSINMQTFTIINSF